MELRSSLLPVEHLDAELTAAPLSADSSFGQMLVALDERIQGATRSLWRELEGTLLGRFPGMSVDELILRRDRIWFGEGPLSTSTRQVPLVHYLRSTLGSLIQAGPCAARLHPSSDSGALALRRKWRWLTFALPADMMLAVLRANTERMDVASPVLLTYLRDRGFAEPHLHLKAALEFPTLWASLQRALTGPDAHAEMFASPGAEFDEGRKLGTWLLRAALCRGLLADFLTTQSHRRLRFAEYLQTWARPQLTRRFGALAISTLWQAMEDVALGRALPSSSDFATLRVLYSDMIGRAPQLSSWTTEEVALLDPVSHWFRPGPDSHPEFRLTTAACNYLETSVGRADTVFARLFWQVARLRVRFYRHIVQRPMTPGLQWFARAYARLSPARKPIPVGLFIEQAAKMSGAGLRSLEVRLNPEPTLDALVHLVQQIDAAAQALDGSRSGVPEVGLIFHFSRSRGAQADNGLPAPWGREANADPSYHRRNRSGYRYAGYYADRRAEAAALGRLLLTFPRMIERVRGLDLCTDELGVPLWVMLPLLEHVRAAGEQAAATLSAIDRVAIPPLRLTVHAGEDFVHLLGGIRRVSEAAEWLRMGDGDRIGHAVAIGVHVGAWVERVPVLQLTVEERLLDLVWAWRAAMRTADESLRSWLSWLSAELERLTLQIFSGSIDAARLSAWFDALHSTPHLRLAGFPGGPRPRFMTPRPQDPMEILSSWLSDPAVFRKGQTLESVDVRREFGLITALQIHVRRQLARCGVAIEINPCSNLLIGHLGDLVHHPLWRICPPRASAADAPPLRVCIGSDDPITFATRLPEEYQLLSDAMLEAGLSAHEADSWLQAARDCGLATCFTMRRSPEALTRPLRMALPIPLL